MTHAFSFDKFLEQDLTINEQRKLVSILKRDPALTGIIDDIFKYSKPNRESIKIIDRSRGPAIKIDKSLFILRSEFVNINEIRQIIE